jgi:hypothetical protein
MITLSTSKPKHIYSTQFIKAFYFNSQNDPQRVPGIWTSATPDKPVEILLYVISNGSTQNQHTITYEILASSHNTLYASIPINQPVEEVSLTQLPLFIHFPFKNPNFDNLLKGDPLNSTDSSPYMTIRFRPK